MTINENPNSAVAAEIKTAYSLSICIESKINFTNCCGKTKQLTYNTGSGCNISTKGIRLQTYIPDSYRATVKFFKKNKVPFYFIQTKENKFY